MEQESENAFRVLTQGILEFFERGSFQVEDLQVR
jgi:hypothetical protein